MPPKASEPRQSTQKSKPAISKSKSAIPKQTLSDPERLKRLFVSLCAQIDGGHFGNALKTCDKILRIDNLDRDALQARLFLLLQTEQYSAALSHVESLEDHSQYEYERAYILYCLHREQEAKELLKTLDGEENKGVSHLEAQIHYRHGDYEAAFDTYNILLDTSEPNTEEHSDIMNNLQASQKLLEFVTTDYLRSLDALPSSISSSLESSLPPQPPTQLMIVSAAAPKAAEQPKEKKVRKARIPRGVVPGVTPPPDPERWLKKSERSTFMTGRKRKGGAGGGATQGVMESAPASAPTPSKGSSGKGKKRK